MEKRNKGKEKGNKVKTGAIELGCVTSGFFFFFLSFK